MPVLPAALDAVVAHLSRLPGIGERSATRLAFFILGEDAQYSRDLGQALVELTERVRFCVDCHMITGPDDASGRCTTCTDPSRDRSILCVVERITDMLAFERTGAYRGLYHVLHGVLSPLKGVGPDDLKLGNLEARITGGYAGDPATGPGDQADAEVAVKEVIVATSTDVEGEATSLYLARRLARTGVRTTRIATGVPMGGDLEYMDQNTLGRALQGRRELLP